MGNETFYWDGLTALLRSAESKYWKENFTEANNSSTFCETVHSITGMPKPSRIGPIEDEYSSEVLDDGMKPNLFN